MMVMKILLLCLLFPVFTVAQTVHIKDDKIVYEGKENLALPSQEISNKAQTVLPKIIDKYQLQSQSARSISATGELKLKTPYHIIRTVLYSIKISSTESGYEYLIDSVVFKEQERGEKAFIKPSKEVLDDMDETGKIVGDTEKILNETDMRFQKLLALLKKEMKEG
jgi:hypothetical protein